MKTSMIIALLASCLSAGFAFAEATPTDKEAINRLIERSINNYNGNCPCPYNRDSAG